jgi:hypothetical protein
MRLSEIKAGPQGLYPKGYYAIKIQMYTIKIKKT